MAFCILINYNNCHNLRGNCFVLIIPPSNRTIINNSWKPYVYIAFTTGRP